MKKGFTLIELLVVVAIIGILAAVGVVAYNGYTSSAKKSAAKANHESVVKYITSEVMKWPKSVSPFDIVIIPSISKNNKDNLQKAEKIYQELKKQNVDVLLDDVDENMSNKFKKHDLIGIPFQIIIGSKSEENKFEFKELNSESEMLSLEDIKSKLQRK